MRKYILFFVLGFVFTTANTQDLRIATFNCEFLVKRKVHIKYDLNFDIRKEPDSIRLIWNDTFREARFREACQAVAEQIVEIDADVIGLTEVGKKEDLEILLEELTRLGLHYQFFELCKSTDTSTGQHVAVLSKFELTDVVKQFNQRALYYTEADMDEVKQTGISKGLKVSFEQGLQKFDLFVFHFKSERGGNESDAQRIAQAEIARRLILPYIKDDHNVIVLGDFNSEKRHKVLSVLRGFEDIGEEMIQTGDDSYFESFENRWTYQFRGNSEQIDHILLSLNFLKLCKPNRWSSDPNKVQFGIKTCILQTTRPIISDHNPIYVDLVFRQ